VALRIAVLIPIQFRFSARAYPDPVINSPAARPFPMLHRTLFVATLMSGLALASVAEAGHSEPTIRLGVDMVWGGGHYYPAPVAWYPPPVYSHAPPPAYGRYGWAPEGRHRHHHHRHHHADRHDGRHKRRHHDH
jgi:hypothetical protein